MLQLIKVPCILVSAASIWYTLTPPQPPPAEEEHAEWTVLEGILRRRYILFTLKFLFGSFSLIEAAVLIAQHALDYPYSRFLLSYFIFTGGSVERICVSPPFIVGALMAIFGGIIRHKCYEYMGRLFTVERSIRKDHILVTSGPYAFVRHPSYTGLLIVFIGMILIHGTKGSWVRESGVLESMVMKTVIVFASALLAYIILFATFGRMSKEDESLHELIGKEWEGWAQMVPYKLVPLVY